MQSNEKCVCIALKNIGIKVSNKCVCVCICVNKASFVCKKEKQKTDEE